MTVVSVADSPWTQFRGPTGDGRAESADVFMQLDQQGAVQWRTPIAGVGWSSPVTDGETIWLTAAETVAASREEIAAKLANVQFAQIKGVVASVTLRVVALNAATGEIRLDRVLRTVDGPGPVHPMNGFASPTPVIFGDRVVCHFGQYGTWCLRTDSGESIWRTALPCDDSVGPGSSPIVTEGNVVIVCDGIDQQYVAALSGEDGSVVWKTPRPPMRSSNGEFQKAYSTPLLITAGDRRQLVIPGAQWCVAYDPSTGREIWRVDHGDGFSTTPMAIATGGLVVFSTGYTRPEIIAVDPSGIGDVTDTHIRWRLARNAPAKPSFVADGGLLHVISDDGIVSAVSLADGRQLYRERLGGMFSSSPFLSGGRIMVGNHEGDVTVFRTGPSYQALATYELNEQIMASPVPMGKDLLVRTKAALYRFGDRR
ncbi:MAG: PQQ-binding-like beta-propeller repeat protein [Planctomycetota bacterium]